MMNSETAVGIEDQQAPGRMFLPTIGLSNSVTILPALVLNVLLLEIGHTFGTSEAATAQLQTAASLFAALTGLLMGVWSVRYPHRSLLLAGLLVAGLAAVGSFLALNFVMLLLFFALFGWGMGIIDPMSYSLIGEHYPLEQRARAIGWLVTSFILASILGNLVFGFIGGVGGEDGWRWAFFGVILPLALLSLGLTLKIIPAPTQSRSLQSTESYWAGFQGIFTNRSATVCLIGNLLLFAGWQAIYIFFVTFLRDRFTVSVEIAALLFSAGGTFYILGSQISGRIVPRFGRKPITVVTAFFMGLFTMVYMMLPTLWIVLGLVYLLAIVSGMRMTASYSLTLEQVPRFRGSMMSLNTTSTALGGALGTSIGGLALHWWGFEGVGLTLGALCLGAALLYYRLVIDPTSEP